MNSEDVCDLSTPATQIRRRYEKLLRYDATIYNNNKHLPIHADSSGRVTLDNTLASQMPASVTLRPPIIPPASSFLSPVATRSDYDTITPMEMFLNNPQMVQQYCKLTLHLAEMTRRALQLGSNETDVCNAGKYACFPLTATCMTTMKSYREEPSIFHPINALYALPDVIAEANIKAQHRKGGVSAKDSGRRFTCDRCPKSYSTVGALKMHVRTHTLPCRCTVCGKAFSRPWLLQGHMRTHTGEKPFSCEHCQRAFADRSNLRAHLQTHSAVKRYRCTSCQKTFSRMSLLLKHQQNNCNLKSVSKNY